MANSNDDFQKKAFELWMAVTMFMSTYQNESNAVVRNVSAMLPYATDLQNFWSAYQSAESNALIKKLHTKIRSRVKLMQDNLNESIKACGTDQRMLDKYSENQSYIERKLNEVYALIPKEPRLVKEPEQMFLDFEEASSIPVVTDRKPDEPVQEKDGLEAKSDRFLKRLNELRVSVNGFLLSYGESDRANSAVSYVSDMEASIKVADSLWRRCVREHSNTLLVEGLLESIRRCLASMRGECEMSMLVCSKDREKYAQNHEYVLKKLDALERALPDSI